MKKLLITALASATALVSTPAFAQAFVTINTGSGTFGNPNLTCTGTATTCTFDDMLTFGTPAGFNLASATISTTQVGNDASTNVDFSSVTLNGVEFTNVTGTGFSEFRNIFNQTLAAGGTNTLRIRGTTGTNGSYGGSLVFAFSPAVPEPATWGMMILGFGAVGGAMRYRRRQGKVLFA